MPYRGDVFTAGEYYHIYNRGANREPIFLNSDNYRYCLQLVKKYHHDYGATIIAYCLMPNHYHFVIRQETNRPLSDFVKVVFNAYVQALNRQKNRTGALFEGRFRHILIDRTEYLEHLCRYVHLNPVKAHLVDRPEDWPFSNYLEWIGERAGSLKDEVFIRSLFPTIDGYRQFVSDWQDYLRSQAVLQRYTLE